MPILDWQRRVVDEYRGIRDKVDNLSYFMSQPDFKEIDETQQRLLWVQKHHMINYRDTLGERIKAFGLGRVVDHDLSQ